MGSINAKKREQITTSKNGTHHGKKGSAHPKMGEFSTRRGWHIQKQGRMRQNGVYASKNGTIRGQKGLAHTKMRQKGSMHPKGTHHNMKHVQKQGKSAGRGRCIPKRDKFEARQGQHMHKRDNTEPEGVSTSKKGMIWGQKGSMHPKGGHMIS